MRGKRSVRRERHDTDHKNESSSRDGNCCVSKPENVIEPEVERRKSRKPCKLAHELAGGKSQVCNSVPAEVRVDSKKGKSSTSEGGSDMKVQGFHHDFELEMDLNDPLQNLVRIIQPSLNLDLSKAGIYLCGVQELNGSTCLKNCVRDGSVGMVKVKLSVQVLPDKRPSINVEDVLQAAAESRPTDYPVPSTAFSRAPLTLSSDRLSSTKKNLISKKRGTRASKKMINDQNTEWVPSESFASLRQSVAIPQDPRTWSASDIATWLSWATQHFDLPNLDIPAFSLLNGSSLCTLSRERFSELVGHDVRDLFWTHLELLRSTYQAAVPVPANPQSQSPRAFSGSKVDKPPSVTSVPRLFAKESTSGSIQLWQFLLELLSSTEHSDLLEWHGEDGEFRLLNPEKVAELWGRVKNKGGMNYEKMSRALRYYYDGNILAKVQGKHFTYKFVCDIKKSVGYTFEELKDLVRSSAGSRRLSPSASNPSSPLTPASGRCESDISVELPLPSQRKNVIGALDMRYGPPSAVSQVAA